MISSRIALRHGGEGALVAGHHREQRLCLDVVEPAWHTITRDVAEVAAVAASFIGGLQARPRPPPHIGVQGFFPSAQAATSAAKPAKAADWLCSSSNLRLVLPEMVLGDL